MKKETKFKYIYIFRHGQTTFNKEEKFTGHLNPNLTSLGIKQAQIIANKLKNKKFQIAFQTKLKRSKDTLKEVLKFHPECTKIIEDNRMIERNYGKLNGISHKKLIEQKGEKYYHLIHRGFNKRPPKGESFADVEKRVKPFIKNIINLIKKEKTNVAISAHGNSIRLFRRIMEKASIQSTCKWFIPYDKVFIYKIKI